jgi:integrase/recombinase XerD
MNFTGFLKANKLSKRTIESYMNQIKQFLEWLQLENIGSVDVAYNDIMAFVRYRRMNGNSIKTVNQSLGVIRWYFEYLKAEKIIEKNPATGIHIKGETRRLPHDILTSEELEKLYHKSKTATLSDKRNKVITGLLVFQGITTGELAELKPQDIDTTKGKITIKAGARTAARTLELKPCQIAEIIEYIQTVRPTILKETNKISKKLIISTGTGQRIQNVLKNLINQLKKQCFDSAQQPKLQSAKQIRASVITNWLKTNNLRQVQYWAGHRYVSSTERYQTGNIEELQKEIELKHPMQ